MAYEISRSFALVVGPGDIGSATSTPAIDTAFAFETSGDAFAIRFVAPVTQAAATLTVYVFCTAVTGTPDFQIEVRNGYSGSGDIDRPETGGSDLASSPSTLSAPTANTWEALTATVSLTAGQVYWVLVKNTHGTPASNNATFQYRGSLDGLGVAGTFAGNLINYAFGAGFTTDGFTTDPTTSLANGSFAPAVLKFGDGSLMGMPFVSTIAHASDTNNRGNRFQFATNLVVSGIVWPLGVAAISGCAIYQGGNLVVAETGDASTSIRSPWRFAPTSLTGGVAYDVVVTFGSAAASSVFYTMGEAEGDVPTDVKACMPSFLIGSVDSANGTFTPDTSQLLPVGLIVDDIPAVSGGTIVGSVFGGLVVR